MPRALVRPALLALLGCLPACGEPPAPRAPAGPDKERLFGDPGLVPTREGERARRELALAGELRAALSELEGVETVTATVELAPQPPRALVTISVAGDTQRQAQLRQWAERAAATVVEPTVQTTVLVDVSPAREPTPVGGLPLPLALALLGLGVSAGIALERHLGARAR